MRIETKHFAQFHFDISQWNLSKFNRIRTYVFEIASKWGIGVAECISGRVVYVGVSRDSVVMAGQELEKYLRRYKGIKFHE